MRDETANIFRQIRIKNGFSEAQVALLLGISEDDYIMFEQGNSPPEDDYFIITGLNYIYGTTLNGVAKTVKEKQFISSVLGNFENFSDALREEFLKAASKLCVLDREEYVKLKNTNSVTEFPYTDADGRAYAALLCECDGECGYYFVALNGNIAVAELKSLGGEKCFEVNKKIYPLKFGEIKMFVKIYAKPDMGDEQK